MMLFVAANDLLTMFVALEVFSLPLYLLCALARRRRLVSQEAALKYFLLGAFASAFFIFGMALLYGFAGARPASATSTTAALDRADQPAAALRRPRAGLGRRCCSRSPRCRSTSGRPTSTRARRPRSPR